MEFFTVATGGNAAAANVNAEQCRIYGHAISLLPSIRNRVPGNTAA
jgi:hypothetical protein